MNEDFVKRAIKGRIAETIFEFMFREDGKYTVIPLGYEHTTPELAQYSNLINQNSHVLDSLRLAPDFALLSKEKDYVYLVEVKYRGKIDTKEILAIVEEKLKAWKISFLFLITPKGFFYGSCSDIKRCGGKIAPLDTYYISTKLQDKYLKILRQSISLKEWGGWGNIPSAFGGERTASHYVGHSYNPHGIYKKKQSQGLLFYVSEPNDILHRLREFSKLFLSDGLNSEYAYLFGLKDA